MNRATLTKTPEAITLSVRTVRDTGATIEVPIKDNDEHTAIEDAIRKARKMFGAVVVKP